MNDDRRPDVVFQFLRWFCPPHLLEEIEGDLLQKFKRDLQVAQASDTSKVSRRLVRKAQLKLLWNVIRFFRPGILLRNRFSIPANQTSMISNYFVISIRHIKKSKVNFTFKLGGLTLAIFSLLSVAIYVSYQLTYDTHHADYQSVYRVNSQRFENGQIEKYGIVPLAIGPLLKQYLPEIKSYARTRYANGSHLRFEDSSISCDGLLEADSSLLSILNFTFIEGDADALKIPNGIVLTQPIAQNLFGTNQALGKLITINNEKTVYQVSAVQVSAVIEKPTHTCFGFEALILNQAESPLTLGSIASPAEFLDHSSTLFVRLKEPVSDQLGSKIETVLDKFIKKSDRDETGFSLSLQPIVDIYLAPELNAEFARKGSAIYMYAFCALGVLLLVVAGINYVNLSIADFSHRARETGVRKVLGARKHELITQVTTEALVFILTASLLALGILYAAFPTITSLLDGNLRFSMLLNQQVLIISAASLMALLCLSCYFPAKLLASSGAIQNLKSKNSSYNSSLSQILLFAQFGISAICISSAVMVGRQISFIHDKELGFDRKNLLILNMPWEFTVKNMQTFKQEIKQIAGVDNASNGSFLISGGYWKDWYFLEQEGEKEMKHVELHEVFSDDELFSTLGIKLLQGRIFSAQIPSDSGAAFVLNESAVKELGWKEPIGKRIYTHPEEKGKWDGTVVGVVADINISPLYEKVKPLVMRLPWTNKYPDAFIYVRYSGNPKPIIQSIEERYKELMPGYPLNYFYVDELFNRSHERESKAFASLQFGTLIIVLISVLGIFSMAMYMSARRTKEFGIRKVLGASVGQISLLHMNYFLRIAFVACAISLPVAFWLIHEWLTTFAYRVELNLWPFVVVALISMAVVILSTGYSAYNSGRMNPVDSIKSEC